MRFLGWIRYHVNVIRLALFPLLLLFEEEEYKYGVIGPNIQVVSGDTDLIQCVEQIFTHIK